MADHLTVQIDESKAALVDMVSAMARLCGARTAPGEARYDLRLSIAGASYFCHVVELEPRDRENGGWMGEVPADLVGPDITVIAVCREAPLRPRLFKLPGEGLQDHPEVGGKIVITLPEDGSGQLEIRDFGRPF